jgi:hypothetical protein
MLTNNVQILTYYTTNTPYEKEVAKLIKSLDDLEIENYTHVGVPNRKNWQLNVQWRPYVIHRELGVHNKDLLVVDADATFKSIPSWDWLSKLDCDIAAHVMDKRFWKQNTMSRNYSLMAGTLFVKNTEASKELMAQWHIACAKSLGRKWDMRILEKILGFNCWSGECKGNYKFENLPAAYCDIDKTMSGVKNTVIKHHQASRRLRKKIK